MKYYFVKFSMDWADEFDYKCSTIMTEEEWDFHLSFLQSYSNLLVSMGFGTNESWEDIPVSRVIKAYTAFEISENTYKELQPILSNRYEFIYPLDWLEDNEEVFGTGEDTDTNLQKLNRKWAYEND